MTADTKTPQLTRFRPLLAATISGDEELAALTYPLIASPKVDGIRIICHPDLGPITRSCKPVHNMIVRDYLADSAYSGFDGEIVVGHITAPDVFQRTTSGVMTHTGSR